MTARRTRRRAGRGHPSTIRLTGGEWRGTRLPVADADGLRPTSERIRETLFNWLAPTIQGARCIDCFAGTGALGLEALSRGAAHVEFFETDGTAANVLQKQLHTLQADERARVNIQDFGRAELSSTTVDIAFIDPPFALCTHAHTIKHLAPALKSDARVYLEYPAEQDKTLASEIDTALETLRTKRAGAVGYRLARPR